MDVGLGWLGVGVGAVGCAVTFALASASAKGESASSDDDNKRARLSAGLIAVLTLVFWAISMRAKPPFSPGQTLGYGFLIGGAAGFAACWLAHVAPAMVVAGSLRARYLLTHCAAFLGLFGVALTYSIFQGNPSDALMGFAIGAAMAAIIRYYLVGIRTDGDDLTILTWAVFSITLAATIVLAVSHFDKSTVRLWWPLPILIATTACIAAFIGTEIGSARRLDTRPGPSAVLSAFVASILVIALSVIYAWRLVQSWPLLEVVVIGIATVAVAAWLIASLVQRRSPAWGLDAASACVLLIVAFTVVAFKLWSGLGIGIGLIAAWAVAAPMIAFRGEDADEPLPRGVSTVLTFGLSILLYRLFIEYYRSHLGSADVRIHYAFIGALVGVILPFLLVSSIYRLRDCAKARGDLCALAGAASLGLFTAASPLVLFLIWGMKAVLGFVFGLTASGAFLLLAQLFHQGAPPENRGPSLAERSPALLVIGAQLVAIQFINPLMEVGITRATQICTLAIAAVLALAWFVVIGACSDRCTR